MSSDESTSEQPFPFYPVAGRKYEPLGVKDLFSDSQVPSQSPDVEAPKHTYQQNEVFFVSTSKQKHTDVKELFPNIRMAVINVPEMQGSPGEIVKKKCKDAWMLCQLHDRTPKLMTGLPVVVEDTSIYFEAMNGFPGPYSKDFSKAMDPKEIVMLCEALGNKNVIVESRVAFADEYGKAIVFTAQSTGEFRMPIRFFDKGGICSRDWNRTLQLTEEELAGGYDTILHYGLAGVPLDEMNAEQRLRFLPRHKAMMRLAKFLNWEVSEPKDDDEKMVSKVPCCCVEGHC